MTAKEIRDNRFRIFRWRGSLKNYFTTGGFDGVFLALLMIILTVGIIMMFSASMFIRGMKEETLITISKGSCFTQR